MPARENPLGFSAQRVQWGCDLFVTVPSDLLREEVQGLLADVTEDAGYIAGVNKIKQTINIHKPPPTELRPKPHRM